MNNRSHMISASRYPAFKLKLSGGNKTTDFPCLSWRHLTINGDNKSVDTWMRKGKRKRYNGLYLDNQNSNRQNK
ncbi:hypothetical protein OIU79_029999 [Salix purpurea]|uniref:Uncharacterized protein n=1 Tax=Salix purpurea TaxID=77065 RepID=A0A9Q0VK53_SALPP|nr:hypothetical protein OIU79_029999 [Salix purpurea]